MAEKYGEKTILMERELNSVSLFHYLTRINKQNKIEQLKSCHNLLI
jgi:hypothetical protein